MPTNTVHTPKSLATPATTPNLAIPATLVFWGNNAKNKRVSATTRASDVDHYEAMTNNPRTPEPTIRRQELGQQLQTLRKASGFTLEQAARRRRSMRENQGA